MNQNKISKNLLQLQWLKTGFNLMSSESLTIEALPP